MEKPFIEDEVVELKEEAATIIPLRWHLYIVDLEPCIRTKPGKRRPCICIQPSKVCVAGHDSAIIIPLTTKATPEDIFLKRIKVPKGTCGLEKGGTALIDRMIAWDKSFFKKDLGEIPINLQEILKSALRDFLDL